MARKHRVRQRGAVMSDNAALVCVIGILFGFLPLVITIGICFDNRMDHEYRMARPPSWRCDNEDEDDEEDEDEDDCEECTQEREAGPSLVKEQLAQDDNRGEIV